MNNKQYISFNHRVVFYVPSTNKNLSIGTIDHARRVNEVALYFSKTFGGATLETAKGFWKSSTGEYITEDITKVISFTDDKTLSNNLNKILNYTKRKQIEYKQEAISLEVDQKFLLID